MSEHFEIELKERVDAVEKQIQGFLPREEGFAKTMAQAMNYSMTAGGKRLRPLLLQETCRMYGGEIDQIGSFLAAMEMIHTHSLIHDDLPALDNDDYRRGRLTTHKVFGEAMGILSGVALLNYAYETMLQSILSSEGVSKDRQIRAMAVIVKKTGLSGMLGGQSVDVENDGKELSVELLDYIYRHKTSALMEAPMMAGAILAGANEEAIFVMERLARNLGLAFQIQDDILDVTSTSKELGKPVHSDEKNHKVTYVTLFGIEEAARKSEQLSQETLYLLRTQPQRNVFLENLVAYLITRKK